MHWLLRPQDSEHYENPTRMGQTLLNIQWILPHSVRDSDDRSQQAPKLCLEYMHCFWQTGDYSKAAADARQAEIILRRHNGERQVHTRREKEPSRLSRQSKRTGASADFARPLPSRRRIPQ